MEVEPLHVRSKKMRAEIERQEKKVFKTNQDFADFLGVDNGTVGNSENPDYEGNKVYSKPFLKRIEAKYGISWRWVKTGIGKMLPNQLDAPVSSVAETEPVPFYGKPTLQKHGEGSLGFPNQNLRILTVTLDHNGQELVRVVNQPAFATYTEAFNDIRYLDRLPTETLPKDLVGAGTVTKFLVKGDSMEPTLYNGDYVYASYVEPRNGPRPFNIVDYQVYVINSRERGLIVKRLYHHVGSGHVDCISDNLDKKRHPNFSMPFEDIQELWVFQRRYTAQAPPPEDQFEDIKRLSYIAAKSMTSIDKKLDKIIESTQLTFDFVKALPAKKK